MKSLDENNFLDSVYNNRGFNAEETLKQTRILEKVMFRTKETKIGRGKKAIVTQVYVYNSEEDEEVRTKIKNTIKHYEAKLETIPKENNK